MPLTPSALGSLLQGKLGCREESYEGSRRNNERLPDDLDSKRQFLVVTTANPRKDESYKRIDEHAKHKPKSSWVYSKNHMAGKHGIAKNRHTQSKTTVIRPQT